MAPWFISRMTSCGASAAKLCGAQAQLIDQHRQRGGHSKAGEPRVVAGNIRVSRSIASRAVPVEPAVHYSRLGGGGLQTATAGTWNTRSMRLRYQPLIAILIALVALPATRLRCRRGGENRSRAALAAREDRAHHAAGQPRCARARPAVGQTCEAAELSVGQARAELGRASREYADRSARRGALAQTRQQQQQALLSERAALAGTAARGLHDRARGAAQTAAQSAGSAAQRPAVCLLRLFRPRTRRADRADPAAGAATGCSSMSSWRSSRPSWPSLKAAQQQQLQQLERARNERQQVLASLTAAAHTREQSLARLKSQQADLERLLQQLNRSLKIGTRRRTTPPPSVARAGSCRGRSPARSRRNSASKRASGVKWEGVVIATERDAPVTAVAAGRVVYADWLPGLGLLAIIDHGEGYLSLYGHNDRLLKAVGRTGARPVRPIAAAGDTGGRASPELYFEIRRAGRPVDPAPWFRTRSPSPYAGNRPSAAGVPLPGARSDVPQGPGGAGKRPVSAPSRIGSGNSDVRQGLWSLRQRCCVLHRITRTHEYTRARAAGGRRPVVGALRAAVARLVAAHEQPERIQCASATALVDRDVGRTGRDGAGAADHPRSRERARRQRRAAHRRRRADLSVLAATRRRRRSRRRRSRWSRSASRRPTRDAEQRAFSFVQALVKPAIECLRRELMARDEILNLHSSLLEQDNDLEMLLSVSGGGRQQARERR